MRVDRRALHHLRTRLFTGIAENGDGLSPKERVELRGLPLDVVEDLHRERAAADPAAELPRRAFSQRRRHAS